MVTNEFFTKTATSTMVTLAEAKKQLRIEADFTEEDTLIQSYIDAAEVAAQNYCNKQLEAGTMSFELNSLTSKFIFGANDDADVVSAISYYAPGESALTVMDAENYKLRKSTSTNCKEIVFTTYPETDKREDAVLIEISQGFTAATLPKPIKQAILLMVTSMYERREDIGEIGYNQASKNLMRAYRNF